jgi:HSP20 family molecular chaperone IbpA
VHARSFVHALVKIMWTDKGILHGGHGFMRDMKSKGIFVYSDSEPPAKGRAEVEASFPFFGEADANVRLRPQSLMIRVEPPPNPEEQDGFAILNRSYKLSEGTVPLKRRT